MQIWSLATNIQETTINTYINTSVPDIEPDISNINAKELPYNNSIIKPGSYNLIKSYITKNDNINLKTLNIFIDQISLPIAKQQMLYNFMNQIFPQVKSSLSNYNKGFLEDGPYYNLMGHKIIYSEIIKKLQFFFSHPI